MSLAQLLDDRAEVVPLSVEQYHKMIDVGILPEGEPIELIDGFLVRKGRSARGEDPIDYRYPQPGTGRYREPRLINEESDVPSRPRPGKYHGYRRR